MKPVLKEPRIVYQIIDGNGEAQGVYNRGYSNDYDFYSVRAARMSNCHNIHMDTEKYKIAKYRVTYELLDDDCPLEEGK